MLVPKAAKDIKDERQSILSQVVAKRLLAYSELKHMVRIFEKPMEMHLRRLSEVSNDKCKPKGPNILHHLKGRGVEISPWTVLADWVRATSQTKIMGFKPTTKKNQRQEWQKRELKKR